MTAKECTVGNWQLIHIKDDLWELHYTGDNWETVFRTTEQIEESKSFYDLFNNYE